ncbi:MAG: DCC1-like thiol-disulfide oxidoreductase family protein [Verrucomicrobiales bacterium]|nr:DCC1-like thiol-disulfide oxidoreductase family protein [Verrucomicrobiales bacterium]
MGWILFFDGNCASCSAGVRRAMRFDHNQRLKFAPLQGKLAAENGFTHYADPKGGSMVIMREEDRKVFYRSDAAIELARALGGWWNLLVPVSLIPRCLRDAAYKWVASHRYWISKKANFCTLPDPEMEKRILE